MLNCQRVAVRIARAWPYPGGWTSLFYLFPAYKEDRAWKWKMKWAQRQLNNLKGVENDAAASHWAMGQTTESNAGPCRVAAGAEAEPPAAAHSAKGQAAIASNLRWRILTVDDTMFAPPLSQCHRMVKLCIV